MARKKQENEQQLKLKFVRKLPHVSGGNHDRKIVKNRWKGWNKGTPESRKVAHDWYRQVKSNSTCITGCGESDRANLHFHHRDPSRKEGAISDMVYKGVPIDMIYQEAKECDIVCVCCHNLIHRAMDFDKNVKKGNKGRIRDRSNGRIYNLFNLRSDNKAADLSHESIDDFPEFNELYDTYKEGFSKKPASQKNFEKRALMSMEYAFFLRDQMIDRSIERFYADALKDRLAQQQKIIAYYYNEIKKRENNYDWPMQMRS